MKRCRIEVNRVFGSNAFKAYCSCGWRGPRRAAGPLQARFKKAEQDGDVHLGPTLFDAEPERPIETITPAGDVL